MFKKCAADLLNECSKDSEMPAHTTLNLINTLFRESSVPIQTANNALGHRQTMRPERDNHKKKKKKKASISQGKRVFVCLDLEDLCLNSSDK